MHDKLDGTQNIGQGKGRKKITKGAHLQTPPIGQKNYHPLSEVFLTPYPNCILEVVELKEQLAKPGFQLTTFTAQQLWWAALTLQLLWPIISHFFHGNFAMGDFCVATFLSRLLNITH